MDGRFSMVVICPFRLIRIILNPDYIAIMKELIKEPYRINDLADNTNMCPSKCYRLLDESKKVDLIDIDLCNTNKKVGRKNYIFKIRISKIIIDYSIENLLISLYSKNSSISTYYFPINPILEEKIHERKEIY
jgi:hypothetical protein